MKQFDISLLKQLYVPASSSHKGENGKVLIIGGSDLFHSPAFWAFEIASKLVDMVYFSSTDLNNEVLKNLKVEFINGILVPRGKVEDYLEEADSILIGPGLPRPDGEEHGDESTKTLTERLLNKFSHKKWVIDGGSLQVIDPELLPKTSIITPNVKEFEMLKSKIQNSEFKIEIQNLKIEDQVKSFAKHYNCIVLLKGEVDFVSDGVNIIEVRGGNAGMTKGGTGDVLAGLVSSFYAKNDAFLSAASASFINKKAGESLEKNVGIYFNATDLVNEIPKVMKEVII